MANLRAIIVFRWVIALNLSSDEVTLANLSTQYQKRVEARQPHGQKCHLLTNQGFQQYYLKILLR